MVLTWESDSHDHLKSGQTTSVPSSIWQSSQSLHHNMSELDNSCLKQHIEKTLNPFVSGWS